MSANRPRARRSGVLALIAAGLMIPAAASAATCVGSCGSMGADGDVTAPPGRTNYGYISTYGGPDGAGQLSSVGGTNGSSFFTSAFSAAEGEALRYDFNFITSDGQSDPDGFIYEDYAFVRLIDAVSGDEVAMLFNARTEPNVLASPGFGLPPIAPGVKLSPATSMIQLGTGAGGGPVWSPLGEFSGACWGPGCGFTGWIRSEYEITQEGEYKLEFGVTNWGDNVYDTGLAYTGIFIGEREIEDHEDPIAVPEPASWALMLTGFATAGAMLRRRRVALQGL